MSRSIEDVNEDVRGLHNNEFLDYCKRNNWYVIENDLIGGWAIGLAEAPMSQHNYNIIVADMISQELAEYICKCHNNELKRNRS